MLVQTKTLCENKKIMSRAKTKAPPTRALYAGRKCSLPIMKTRIFISQYLKK